MKSRIAGNISESALRHLILKKIDDSSIHWENDREFSCSGVMYDVIDKRQQEGKEIIYCIPDKNETDLVAAFQNINKQQRNGTENTASFCLLKLMSTSFMAPSAVCIITPVSCLLNKKDFSTSLLLSRKQFVSDPPPWNEYM